MPKPHRRDRDHEYVPVLVHVAAMPSGPMYGVRVECPCGAHKTYVNVPAERLDVSDTPEVRGGPSDGR